MPVYEYRCLDCDARWELRRAAADADSDAPCPGGHLAARRLLSVFAAGRPQAGPAPFPSAGGGGGGGCCGGGCGCGAG